MDADALRAQFNETIAKPKEEKLSAPKELTGDDLASVAGGADDGDKTMAYIIGGIGAVAAIGAAVSSGIALYRNRAGANVAAGQNAGNAGAEAGAGAGAGGADNLSASSDSSWLTIR